MTFFFHFFNVENKIIFLSSGTHYVESASFGGEMEITVQMRKNRPSTASTASSTSSNIDDVDIDSMSTEENCVPEEPRIAILFIWTPTSPSKEIPLIIGLFLERSTNFIFNSQVYSTAVEFWPWLDGNVLSRINELARDRPRSTILRQVHFTSQRFRAPY